MLPRRPELPVGDDVRRLWPFFPRNPVRASSRRLLREERRALCPPSAIESFLENRFPMIRQKWRFTRNLEPRFTELPFNFAFWHSSKKWNWCLKLSRAISIFREHGTTRR